MALNFPDSPTLNQIYTDSTSGFSYQWNGSVWISYSASTTSNITELDDISSSFNGVTTTFALTVSGTAVTPVTTNQLLISVGGVMQNPTNDFYISGSNIVFTTAPAAGLTFFGYLLGTALPLTTIADGSVTPVKLSTGGPSWDTDGDVTITGTGTTALLVNGNARVTGILTVGTGSITINGVTDRINVGTGLTLSSSGIIAGVVTATSFFGDGSGLSGVSAGSSVTNDTSTNAAFYPLFTQQTSGTVTASRISTSKLSFNPSTGILTATGFAGNGASLTGISAFNITPEILTFSPTDGSTGNSTGTAINLFFNQGMVKGIGDITLRSGSAGGTILQTIGVSSTSVSISGAQVTITPPTPLPISTDVYVVVPSGAFKTISNVDYVGVSTYNFTTIDDKVSTYSPANGATNVSFESSITLTFPFTVVRGTGVVEIRRGSVGGTLVESFDATTSNRISISGNQWILDPTNLLPAGDTIFVIIPATAIQNYDGLNIGGATKTYSFSTQAISNVSFNPLLNATGVNETTNITLTFNNAPERGTGTIELRGDSATGQILGTYDAATDSRITISGTQWILNPSIDLPPNRQIFLIVPNGAIVSFVGLTIGGGTTPYGFTTRNISYSLFAWGSNGRGQVGQNNRIPYSSPIQIPGTIWRSVSGSYGSVLATKTDGTLWSFGYNNTGQLGLNNRVYYSSPVQIPGTQWAEISANKSQSSTDSFALATKTDGTLWSWGQNQSGALGQNDATQYSSPVQIPGTTWSSISSGARRFALAIKTNGTLWSWGYNNRGQLGQNNLTSRSSPVQVPGTTWNSISAGEQHSLATKTDGTLWSWGYNNNGQLGQNNITQYQSPIQIPGNTWSSVSAGYIHTLATKTDGTLWSWGYNGYGQLGLNSTSRFSSPVQVPGTTWSLVSASYRYSLASKTDGTLWAWGENGGIGVLGQNNNINYSSPVQIPGTTWNPISVGKFSAYGIRKS